MYILFHDILIYVFHEYSDNYKHDGIRIESTKGMDENQLKRINENTFEVVYLPKENNVMIKQYQTIWLSEQFYTMFLQHSSPHKFTSKNASYIEEKHPYK